MNELLQQDACGEGTARARIYIDWCKDTTNYRNGKGKEEKYSVSVRFLAVAVP